MVTKGFYRAEALRACLQDSPLTTALAQQLTTILQEQFKEESYREVGGVAYFKNNWLDLQTVQPPEILEVEKALQQFSHGNYAGLEKLTLFVEHAVDFHQKHHGMDHLFNAIKLSFQVAYEKSMKTSELHIPEDNRKMLVEKYKELMHYYTIVPLNDHFNQKGFLGWFHVHPSGAGPSPADIASSTNSDIPALVFSALPSYLQTGMDIYLLHAGNVELVYQGLLEPKQ